MKKALLQVADSGPMESLVVMLRAAGYHCHLPSDSLKRELRSLGCDTVLDVADLVRGMGYSEPMRLPEAGAAAMSSFDLYVDVKAHRNLPRIRQRWPWMETRTLWYRINGGRPEVVPGCGDEVDPPCPVLTPNQWYATEGPWIDRAYVCWPPFYRQDEYYPVLGRISPPYREPICLIHNLDGWGYRDLVEPMRGLGVRCYGRGSPDGLVQHGQVPEMLRDALCMVHLKSNDAPGYALYEALAAACPVVCTRRLIWRCRMQDLLIPGETCLVYDRETHDGLTPDDVAACTAEVREHLDRLRDPGENERIGMAGRRRLLEVMWREDRDGPGLREWLGRMYL